MKRRPDKYLHPCDPEQRFIQRRALEREAVEETSPYNADEAELAYEERSRRGRKPWENVT